MFDLDSQGVYGLAQICGAAGAGKVNPLKCLALSPISILNSDISRPDPLYQRIFCLYIFSSELLSQMMFENVQLNLLLFHFFKLTV